MGGRGEEGTAGNTLLNVSVGREGGLEGKRRVDRVISACASASNTACVFSNNQNEFLV